MQKTIKETINQYLADSVFNATFSVTHLTDKLQQIAGIINPVFIAGEAKNYYKIEYEAITDYYVAAAGYCVLEELTLEFVPYV